MISQRMCVVCRSICDKTDLIRVVKRGGTAELDLEFRIEGRGAYICKTRECIEKARRVRAFERSLSMRVPAEVYDYLEDLVKGE